MKYVYVVEDWIDDEVLAVFDNEEKAIEYCKKILEQYWHGGCVDTDFPLREYYRSFEEDWCIDEIIGLSKYPLR